MYRPRSDSDSSSPGDTVDWRSGKSYPPRLNSPSRSPERSLPPTPVQAPLSRGHSPDSLHPDVPFRSRSPERRQRGRHRRSRTPDRNHLSSRSRDTERGSAASRSRSHDPGRGPRGPRHRDSLDHGDGHHRHHHNQHHHHKRSLPPSPDEFCRRSRSPKRPHRDVSPSCSPELRLSHRPPSSNHSQSPRGSIHSHSELHPHHQHFIPGPTVSIPDTHGIQIAPPQKHGIQIPPPQTHGIQIPPPQRWKPSDTFPQPSRNPGPEGPAIPMKTLSPSLSPNGAVPGRGDGSPGPSGDRAALLMWSLSAWYRDHSQSQAVGGFTGKARRKLRRMRTFRVGMLS